MDLKRGQGGHGETHFHRARLWSRLPGHAQLVTSAPDGMRHTVALTFDDGPDPAGTPPVLNVLEELGATATFFLLVDRALAHPGLVQRVVDAGHTVGLHGDRHERLDRADARDLAVRLEHATRALEDLVQRRVTRFRPPFGRVSMRLFRAAARAGLSVVLWSHDPKDWEPASADEVSRRVGACLEPGALVLLHDGPSDGRPIGASTARTLRALAPRLADFDLVGL